MIFDLITLILFTLIMAIGGTVYILLPGILTEYICNKKGKRCEDDI